MLVSHWSLFLVKGNRHEADNIPSGVAGQLRMVEAGIDYWSCICQAARRKAVCQQEGEREFCVVLNGVEQLATWVLLDTMWNNATRIYSKNKDWFVWKLVWPRTWFWDCVDRCWHILHATLMSAFGFLMIQHWLAPSTCLSRSWHRWQDITSGTMALGCKVSFQVYKDFSISWSEKEILRPPSEQIIWSQPVIMSKITVRSFEQQWTCLQDAQGLGAEEVQVLWFRALASTVAQCIDLMRSGATWGHSPSANLPWQIILGWPWQKEIKKIHCNKWIYTIMFEDLFG